MTVLCRVINSEDEQKIVFAEEHQYYLLDTALRSHNKHLVNYIELSSEDVHEIIATSKKILYLNEDYISEEGIQ